MRKYKLEPIFEFFSHWDTKQFALGLHLSSEDLGPYREYYLLISLGFWQISLGFSK
ncbi:MAG TPA: hypothetical protein VIM70_06200 [Clostridium sp.]|uniref:hypothetical protein n=1 Tax=Clostridium sp. TaxID=1506 RepID=UPI002F929F8A